MLVHCLLSDKHMIFCFLFCFVFLAFLMIETNCKWTGICVGLQVIQIVLALNFSTSLVFIFHFPLSCILCHIMTERENKYWTGWKKFQLQDNSYHNIDNACPLHGRTKPVKEIFFYCCSWIGMQKSAKKTKKKCLQLHTLCMLRKISC